MYRWRPWSDIDAYEVAGVEFVDARVDELVDVIIDDPLPVAYG